MSSNLDKIENDTKEEVLPPKEVLPLKEDNPNKSVISVIKSWFSTNNKPIIVKEEVVIDNEKKLDNEKPLDDEKNKVEETDNKITETLDVLVEEIETRKQKTFIERIFSFMLRPCSS